MAQVINGIALNNTEGVDRVTSTDKITAGYFTGNDTKLEGSSLHSASLNSTQENYYFGIAETNETGSIQFYVTFGHNGGTGSNTSTGNIKGETEAIYKEWANILISPTEVTGGFKISSNKNSFIFTTFCSISWS